MIPLLILINNKLKEKKIMSITIKAVYNCPDLRGESLVAPLKRLNGRVVKTLKEGPSHLLGPARRIVDLIGLLLLYAILAPVACVGMVIKFSDVRKIHNQQQEQNLQPAYTACRQASPMTPEFLQSYGKEEIEKLAQKKQVASFTIDPKNVEQIQQQVNQKMSEFSRKNQKVYVFWDLHILRGAGGGSIDLFVNG